MRSKSEERKKRIVDVAAKLFCKHGFNNASMSEITAEVGGSKATIYKYFNSKEEIFACAAEKFAQDHKRNLRDSLKNLDNPIEETLTNFSFKFIKFILSPEIVAAKRMLYASDIPEEVRLNSYKEGAKHTVNVLAEYFRGEMDKGIIKNADPVNIAWQFLSVLIHEYLEKAFMIDTFKPSDEEINDHIASSIALLMSRYKV